MHANQSSPMPRYDVISCRSDKTDTLVASPSSEFISAVNGALAAGATLVGGVSTTAVITMSNYAIFCYSQAVLYP